MPGAPALAAAFKSPLVPGDRQKAGPPSGAAEGGKKKRAKPSSPTGAGGVVPRSPALHFFDVSPAYLTDGIALPGLSAADAARLRTRRVEYFEV